MDPYVLASDIIKEAVKRGCEKAEVFMRKAKRLSAEAQDSAIEAIESSRDIGISLKVLKNGKTGFSFTTDPFSREGVSHIINEAVNSSEWTSVDPNEDIPEVKPPAHVHVLDKEVQELRKGDVMERTLDLERAARGFDKRIKKVRKAKVALSVSETSILNSKGISISYEGSLISAQVAAFADDGSDNQMGWDFAVSRRSRDIDFGAVARGASKKATELLGARRISNAKIPVILDSSVAVDFLGIFIASLSAEAVQKNRSFLAGKAGRSIVSPMIDMIDDALLPWGTGTSPVDDEGVPGMKKTMVSGGVLKGYLHNTYTARKQGVESTGNASRGSFKSPAGIDVTNFYLKPFDGAGSAREAEAAGIHTGEKKNGLIKLLNRGILVLEAMGVHTANPVSGDFSVGISGLWIENGEVQFPFKEAVITGNIIDLFRRVEGVGSDLRFYGRTGTPSLLIGEMDISA